MSSKKVEYSGDSCKPVRHKYWSVGRHRYLCEVLEDMRKCDQTKTYGALAGYIEEVQTLANKMEAGLDIQRNEESQRKQMKIYQKEIKRMEKKLTKLKKQEMKLDAKAKDRS